MDGRLKIGEVKIWWKLERRIIEVDIAVATNGQVLENPTLMSNGKR